MKTNWTHKQICGIYCIENTVNHKFYIGKAVSIARRIYSHIYELTSGNSHCTKLLRAWKKYESENFSYRILEEIDKNREDFKNYIADREVFWMDELNSINNGYNLKRDSSSECIHSKETKLKMSSKFGKLNSNFGNRWSEEKKKHLSELKKQMYKEGLVKRASKEDYAKGAITKKLKWEKDPSLLKQMVDKCNLTKIKYEIHQFTKAGKLVHIWKDIIELTTAHPEYKRHNIYAVCSGEKPRGMYGFMWKKVLKSNI